MKFGNRIGQILGQINKYRELVALVHGQTGKGLLEQCREINSLRQAGGACGISDYYDYRIYDHEYQIGRGAPDYLGWRLQQQFSLALNPRYAVLPGWDKLVFTLMANAAGLPVAPVRACFHRSERLPEVFGVHLKSREAAAAFLRDQSIYPLFGKPAFSQQGYGALHLLSYDPDSDTVKDINGKSDSVSFLLNRLERTVDRRFHKPECGYLFQEPFTPASEIIAVTNWSAICGVRVICLNGPDGVMPISASWKIAMPPNQVDNFSNGELGNLSADINLETGEVGRVVNGFWPKAEIFVKHPISGIPLKGFKLPGWRQLLDACKAAGQVFPLMKIHHWDFALTDKGPLILELNDLGGVGIDQAYGRGLLTMETREFLKQHGNVQDYPWIARL